MTTSSSRTALTVFPIGEIQLYWKGVRNTLACLLFGYAVLVGYGASGYLRVSNQSGRVLKGIQMFKDSGDGPVAVGGTFDLAVDEEITSLVSWTGGADGGTDSITMSANIYGPPATKVGNSWVADGSPEFVEIGSSAMTTGVSSESEPYVMTIDSGAASVRTPNDEAKKSLWIVEDETLTPEVFREGIDKLAQLFPSGDLTGGGIGDEGLDLLSQINTALTPGEHSEDRDAYIAQVPLVAADFQTNLYGEGGLNVDLSGIPVTAPTIPSVGDDWAIIPDLEILGHNFQFRPFAFMSGLLPGMSFMRLCWLVGLWISFAWFTQKKFEQYSIIWWQTTQWSTKVEPAQVLLPGVGWAKQLAGALVTSAVLVVTAGLFVAMANGLLGGVVTDGSGLNVFNMPTTVKTGLTTAFEGVGDAVGVFDKFYPLAATFEYMVLHYTIAWTMPAQWAFVLYVQKFFQP